MKDWILRLSIASISCAAMLLSPPGLAALGSINPVTPEQVVAKPSYNQGEPRATMVMSRPIVASAQQDSAEHVAPSLNEHANEQAEDVTIEAHIQQWVEALSQEAEFAAWRKAAWDLYPLGPGTHSWVVLLHSGDTELGYMVIGATEDGGYQLVEYGAGDYPLFSYQTLYHSLVQHGLISDQVSLASFITNPTLSIKRWYTLPLQAVWQVEARYFDAKTGEELPTLTSWVHNSNKQHKKLMTATSSSADTSALLEVKHWTPTDPFVRPGWLKGKPLQLGSFEEWKKAAASPSPPSTYMGKWFGGVATYPLAISGYHTWSDNRSYVRLEHSGPRYALYEVISSSDGGFYPQSR